MSTIRHKFDHIFKKLEAWCGSCGTPKIICEDELHHVKCDSCNYVGSKWDVCELDNKDVLGLQKRVEAMEKVAEFYERKGSK